MAVPSHLPYYERRCLRAYDDFLQASELLGKLAFGYHSALDTLRLEEFRRKNPLPDFEHYTRPVAQIVRAALWGALNEFDPMPALRLALRLAEDPGLYRPEGFFELLYDHACGHTEDDRTYDLSSACRWFNTTALGEPFLDLDDQGKGWYPRLRVLYTYRGEEGQLEMLDLFYRHAAQKNPRQVQNLPQAVRSQVYRLQKLQSLPNPLDGISDPLTLIPPMTQVSFSIDYDDGQQFTYRGIDATVRRLDGKAGDAPTETKLRFDTGNFGVDYIDFQKAIPDDCEILTHSSSFTHFISDGDAWESVFILARKGKEPKLISNRVEVSRKYDRLLEVFAPAGSNFTTFEQHKKWYKEARAKLRPEEATPDEPSAIPNPLNQ